MLLEKFDVDVSKLPANEHPHQCCDVCQQLCKCDGDSCNFEFFNSDCPELVETETKDRTVTEEQMAMLLSKLDYLKRALKSAVHGEAHARAEWLKNKLYGSTLNSN